MASTTNVGLTFVAGRQIGRGPVPLSSLISNSSRLPESVSVKLVISTTAANCAYQFKADNAAYAAWITSPTSGKPNDTLTVPIDFLNEMRNFSVIQEPYNPSSTWSLSATFTASNAMQVVPIRSTDTGTESSKTVTGLAALGRYAYALTTGTPTGTLLARYDDESDTYDTRRGPVHAPYEWMQNTLVTDAASRVSYVIVPNANASGKNAVLVVANGDDGGALKGGQSNQRAFYMDPLVKDAPPTAVATASLVGADAASLHVLGAVTYQAGTSTGALTKGFTVIAGNKSDLAQAMYVLPDINSTTKKTVATAAAATPPAWVNPYLATSVDGTLVAMGLTNGNTDARVNIYTVGNADHAKAETTDGTYTAATAIVFATGERRFYGLAVVGPTAMVAGDLTSSSRAPIIYGVTGPTNGSTVAYSLGRIRYSNGALAAQNITIPEVSGDAVKSMVGPLWGRLAANPFLKNDAKVQFYPSGDVRVNHYEDNLQAVFVAGYFDWERVLTGEALGETRTQKYIRIPALLVLKGSDSTSDHAEGDFSYRFSTNAFDPLQIARRGLKLTQNLDAEHRTLWMSTDGPMPVVSYLHGTQLDGRRSGANGECEPVEFSGLSPTWSFVIGMISGLVVMLIIWMSIHFSKSS